jgi:hypothetical protein
MSLESGLDRLNPPPGAWTHTVNGETVIGAVHRAIGQGMVLLLFAAPWNFLFLALVRGVLVVGTLQNLGLPVPDWLAVPGGPISLGALVFFSIFLTPFILAGLFLAALVLSAFFGRTEVRTNGQQGVVAVSIGPFVWRRRFDATAVRDVRIDTRLTPESDGDSTETYIIIEMTNGPPTGFGMMLRGARRQFVAAALRRALVR